DTVGEIVESTQLVGHGVDITEAGVVEGHTGQVFGVSHLVAGFQIVSVSHGRSQPFGYQLDRLDGAGVGDRGGNGGNVRLDRVGQRVHAGGGSQRGGHGHHQERIVDRNVGGAAPVDDGHLHMGVGVGGDAEAGHFACRAGGGVDGQERRHRFGGLVYPFEVANVAAVADHEAHPLAAVMGAAAPQRHDPVTLVVLIHLNSGMYVLVGGVRLGAVEDDRLQAGLF